MAVKKCPLCKKTYDNVDSLSVHIESEHTKEIPEDWSGGKYYFFRNNGKTTGKCVVCRKDTTFNETTYKTNRFCSNIKCPVVYREDFLKRMKGAGKEDIMNDAEHQKMMLSNRSIAKDYKWSDGSIKRAIGSYEYDACQFMDIFMQLESNDVMVPAPQVLEYTYNGNRHKYIPDMYIASLNLIVEIKDGGDNPNMHHKIQSVDKVKEREKEKALKNYSFNYIKIENKQYGDFINLFMKLKNMDIIEAKKFDPIIITNEMVDLTFEFEYDVDIVAFRDKKLNLFDEVGLLVHDKLYVYNRKTIQTINVSDVNIITVYDVDVKYDLSKAIYDNIECFMDMEFDYDVNEINFPIAFIYEILKTMDSNYPYDIPEVVLKGVDEYVISEIDKIEDYIDLPFLLSKADQTPANDYAQIGENTSFDNIEKTSIGEYMHYRSVVTAMYNSNRMELLNSSELDNSRKLISTTDIIDKALSKREIDFATVLIELDPELTGDFKMKAKALLDAKLDVLEAEGPTKCEYNQLLSSPDLLKIHYSKVQEYDKKYNGLAKRVSNNIATGLIDLDLLDEISSYKEFLTSDVTVEELYYLGINPT